MKRKQELNYMNAIACLCVILIHVLSLGIGQAERTSWQAAVIYFPWRLVAYVVPMFLYTGALKLAQQFEGKTITLEGYIRYCLKRVKKIYLPYVLWVGIYYLSFLGINYVRGEWKEFFDYLWIGNLSSPFYYIVIVMQFYFLMPLWVWMLRRVPVWLGMTLSTLVTLCMQQFPYVLSLAGIEFAYTDRIFPTYLVFWAAGLYAGKYYEKTKEAVQNRTGQVICTVVVLGYLILSYLQHARGLSLFNLNEVKIAADLMTIALLHGLCLRLTGAGGRLRNGLQKIYESSFFVYLSHCVFLTVGTAVLQGAGMVQLLPLLVCRLVICYTVPFALYFIYNRTLNRIRPLSGILG